MRRRSKTLQERRRKDRPTQLPQDADSSSLKEVLSRLQLSNIFNFVRANSALSY